MRAEPARRLPTLYAIADVDVLGAERTMDAVAAMAEAGIELIQLRAKRLADDRLAELGRLVLDRLDGADAALWIDDRVDLAMLLPFAGVHLGQRDLPPSLARPLLSPTQRIGWSTHDLGQLARGDQDAAVDWLAVGPVFPTTSKRNPEPVVGLAGVAAARRRTRKPLVAIGGIDEHNLGEVLAAGADAVAVLSAICRGDVGGRARRLLRAVEAVA